MAFYDDSGGCFLDYVKSSCKIRAIHYVKSTSNIRANDTFRHIMTINDAFFYRLSFT